MTNEYLEMIKKAQDKRLKVTKKQLSYVKGLYSDIAHDLNNDIVRAKKGSLSERWLIDYKKQFDKDIREINKLIGVNLKEGIETSAKIATNINRDFLGLVNDEFALDMGSTFSNMFSKIPSEVLKDMIDGKIYKDGKGLSDRLWNHGTRSNKDIDYIIQKGLVQKKSVYDLAKDLEKFINPNKKQDMDFKRIYPSVGNKKIEYNSFRLAVTSISHSYQLSLQKSCKANPFVEGIQWHTSNSHRGTCLICQDRNGIIYDADKLPLDHPLGVCYFTPVLGKSMEDIGTELKKWVDGESNKKLDQFFPKIAAPESKKDPQKKEQKNEPINFNKMQEVFKNKRLGKVWPEIESKINASPEFMQKWYSKFQDKLKFDRTSDPKYAYYSPSTKGLTMHVRRDVAATNSKGACSTFFHEFGHLLDDASRKLTKVNDKWVLSGNISEDKRFVNAIKEDYQDRLNMPLFQGKPQPFVEGKLTDLLRAEGDHASGVQDMYSGLTLNRVRPKWGHDTKYWLRGNTELEIASEAFAHMSSGFTNPERLKIMKEWFPKSCDAFQTIINELID